MNRQRISTPTLKRLKRLHFSHSHRLAFQFLFLLISFGTLLAVMVLFVLSSTPVGATSADTPPVMATEDANMIVLDNGTVTLEISKAKSQIVSIKYRHDGKITELSKTMYYSSAAGPTDPAAPRPPKGSIQPSQRQPNRLVRRGPDMAEVVMENGPTPTYPLHTETHYLLPRGESGFYAYQLYSHPADQPGASVGEARFVIKGPPGTGLFDTHVVDAQRMAPYDTSPVVKQVSDATFLLEDGKIYTKYDNSAFMGDHFFHGMTGHGVGLWMINASNEYVNGGPLKQELTVHADNTLLNMLQGGHYGGGGLSFAANEAYTKFYGPFLVYINSGDSTPKMFRDAQQRLEAEKANWPYGWVTSPEFPTVRGTVTGKIGLVANPKGKGNSSPDSGTAKSAVTGAWAILAAPGGDWPLQARGYQFYTRLEA